MSRAVALDKKVTKIAEDYFGPAASRFMSRLACNHLDKDLDQITLSDMPELIGWARFTASMLTEDKMVVEEFTNRLSLLAK